MIIYMPQTLMFAQKLQTEGNQMEKALANEIFAKFHSMQEVKTDELQYFRLP